MKRLTRAERLKRLRKRGLIGKVSFDIFIAVYTVAVCILAVHYAINYNEDDSTEQIEAAAAVTATAEKKQTPEPKAKNVDMDVPNGDTAFKSYMSYKAITNTASAQYKLQRKCWTDGNGLRRYKTYYVVALGSYYADHIGERFIIRTDEGNEFECIVGDYKADGHTDDMNQYTPMENRKCVVEFVVDTKHLDRKARKMGDISYIEGFSGNIKTIEKEQ